VTASSAAAKAFKEKWDLKIGGKYISS